MKPELKTKWVEALRSGEFKQGMKRLRHGGRHCCLGVLCEIMGEPIRRGQEMPGTRVDEAAGFDGNEADNIAAMNDEGQPFTDIADWIEAHL